jgi:hypothetical protein
MALALGATFSSAQAQAQKPGQDVFLDVIVNNRFFRAKETAPSISVRTRVAVNLDCLIYDVANRLIAHKAIETRTNQFTLSLDHLPPAPKGTYLFGLVASGPGHERVGVYPKSPGGGEIIHVRESELNPEKGTISYTLPRAACVRLRAGFRDGLYLQPIISGEAQPAGQNTVAWDGSSQAGLFTNLYQHPAVHVSILAVSLPANILVSQPLANSGSNDQTVPALGPLPSHLADLASPPWLDVDEKKRANFLIADDYTLSIETLQDAATRTVEIRTDCLSANRSRLFNQRFELMLFLDTTFLVEDEHSQLPFSYRMSTRGLVPGRHILTANVIDSVGSVGTVSKEFNIFKP